MNDGFACRDAIIAFLSLLSDGNLSRRHIAIVVNLHDIKAFCQTADVNSLRTFCRAAGDLLADAVVNGIIEFGIAAIDVNRIIGRIWINVEIAFRFIDAPVEFDQQVFRHGFAAGIDGRNAVGVSHVVMKLVGVIRGACLAQSDAVAGNAVAVSTCWSRPRKGDIEAVDRGVEV